jgi:hypothetical protein
MLLVAAFQLVATLLMKPRKPDHAIGKLEALEAGTA